MAKKGLSYTGLATGFFNGDFGALMTALSTGQNDILSTPSVVTLDNKGVVQRRSGRAGTVRFANHQRRQRL
jgi:hypothetical protein